MYFFVLGEREAHVVVLEEAHAVIMDEAHTVVMDEVHAVDIVDPIYTLG